MFRPTLKFVALAAVAALALTGCSSSDNNASTPKSTAAAATPDASGFVAPAAGEKGSKDNPVKIGVVGASGDQWPVFTALAEKSGIYVDLVDFTSYQQPNPATTSGELDLNQFQHILFLAQYNNESGSDLTPIGATAIYPLGLYSKQYKTLAEIPDGAQIAIQDDGTNQARALGVLASAGLITLKAGTVALKASPEDVEASSRVKVTPVAADQTARALDDPTVAAAIVNNDYITEANIDPATALAKDDPSSDAARPFINIWVAQAKDKDNPVYTKLVEIFHDKTVTDALQKNSGGTAVIVNDDAAALQGYLADAQSALK